MTVPLLPVPADAAARLDGTPLVILLDVDGTLAPIAPRPDAARVPPETRRIVAGLAALPGVSVVLVSGRAAADAQRMVGVPAAWTIGNHGFELLRPDGERITDPALAHVRPAIADAARELAAGLGELDGVLLEDKHWTLTVHFRQADPRVVPRVGALVHRAADARGLLVMEGKMVLEIRPPVEVHKGTAVLHLARQLGVWADAERGGGGGGGGGQGAVLYVGDDRTDEDAFRLLRERWPRAITARVSSGDAAPTAAEFALSDPDAVRAFLEWLLARRRG